MSSICRLETFLKYFWHQFFNWNKGSLYLTRPWKAGSCVVTCSPCPQYKALCQMFTFCIADYWPPHTPAHTHTFPSYPSFSAHRCAACGLSELMTNLFMSRESFSVFHYFFFFSCHIQSKVNLIPSVSPPAFSLSAGCLSSWHEIELFLLLNWSGL